jgi:hypothetical protein
MDEALRDIRLDIIMLRMVAASGWANYLANGAKDPTATCRRIAAEMASAIEASTRDGSGIEDPVAEATLQDVLLRVDRFWEGVEEQLAAREAGATRPS